MYNEFRRRIGRDFLTDHNRPSEAHRAAFWQLVEAVEKLLADHDYPGLQEAVESSLKVLEYNDQDTHH
jgi:hypothetical protein